MTTPIFQYRERLKQKSGKRTQNKATEKKIIEIFKKIGFQLEWNKPKHRKPSNIYKPPSRRNKTTAFREEIPLGNPKIRFLIVWGILITGILALILNLYRLQVIRSADLQEQAQEQQRVNMRPFIPRRSIVDRIGNVVAIDQPVYTLYAHPRLFKESKAAIASEIAPLLKRAVAEIQGQLNTAESGIRITDDLSEDLAKQIKNKHLDGLELIESQKRFYPQQDIAADVVGYVDLDRKGQAGIEYTYQDLLERSIPPMLLNRTLSGALVPDRVPENFLRLDELSLHLTIDSRLQRAARSALKKQLKESGAKRGMVTIMDAKDGSLLALVCEPSYNPNQYYNFDVGLYKNWALTDIYEPGSTFKPIAVAIALEAGAIGADSVFHDEGRIYVDGWPISNSDYDYVGGRGALSVAEIVQYSSNVGMVHIVQQMNSRIFYGWLQRLGLGATVKIDLPFEVPSQLRSQDEFIASPVHAATASFGQGLALTPIQLTQLHASLANGGKIVTPHVVRGLLNSQREVQWTPKLPPSQHVFSPKTTQAVISMMEKVVSEGTGKNAQIPGYRIAGKTGTSQKVTSDGSGYSDYARIASFVGIIPAQAPRYVVLAVIDEPQGGYGGTVAAPVVRSVMEALIATEGIPPSEENPVPSEEDIPPSED